MSTKEVFIRIKDLKIENYKLVPKNETMNTFVDEEGEKVSLHITIKKAEVKFLPGKYDKIVVIPQEIDEFKRLEEIAKESFPVESYLRDGTIGFKCSEEIKKRLQNVNQRDCIDLCFTYNGVLKYNDKYYPSFTLQDFEKVVHAGKKKFLV